ncbi:SMI1/KNR4 family protein [Bhargavaea ginsengi]|uniref:SMI1/KNR4 family protein n=1 Tax=Bhargavaea ginsengi TaxID=426757 RepID=UPI003C739CD5
MEQLIKRYRALYPLEGTSGIELKNIENNLDIKLPDDFKEIAQFYSGGLLGGISHFSISDEDDPTIAGETLRLRQQIGLPRKYVVLAEPPSSLIVMDTAGTPAVIWVDATDAEHLGKRALAIPPDEWATYRDFFEALLDEEEEEREVGPFD